MNVMEAIQGRRSIRKYLATSVAQEKLERVLEAGRLAPSAGNSQQWKFIVVKDPETKAKLAEASQWGKFLKDAPIALVVCGLNPNMMSCDQPRHTVDLSIALSFMILEAYEQGLGTCWLGCHDQPKYKEILGIPENVSIVAVTPLGYPDEHPAQRTRKSLDEVVCYDQYK